MGVRGFRKKGNTLEIDGRPTHRDEAAMHGAQSIWVFEGRSEMQGLSTALGFARDDTF
jgi:hypothetical protein